MERIYAPWRHEYVTEEKIKGCVFCHIAKNLTDEKMQVLFSDELCYVVMNKYPYSPGHIMVIPYSHTDKIEDLEEEIWLRMSKRVQQGVKLLKDVMNAQGVNIGMNLSDAAGAGIAEHVHYHLLPRWKGDTNFISVIGNTRVYPVDFEEIYTKLKISASKYFL
ncbi:HIT family protein [Malaciobacter mytili]|uniref:HIT family hydrolase n=1 Tax=Malaciobacter mytili LMG 24559 TaxID=1032238 RepID=A0AAX2ALB8_9BACT|nr:HIT domain-containing protein [Malaciobacter mytili]AXH14546.1 histidine triad nucleotide-binding protein, Fhit branch [Malaciobacter mytili LMG 24559]RXK16601.1 HIT family hydrolase [Malaciobacter mytili LMG 24559]